MTSAATGDVSARGIEELVASPRGGRAGRARRLARDPARRGDDAARPERRRQVDARARGRRRAAPERRPGPARRRGPHAAPARADPRAPASRSSPRDGGCCRELTVEDNLRVATYALEPRASATTGSRYALELFPRARGALEGAGAAALRRRAADGRARPGARLAAEDPARRRALARPRAGRRQAPRADARGGRRERRRRPPDRAVRARRARRSRRRAYVLEGGRIRYHGTAQELKEHPELLHSAYLLREQARRRPR